MVNEEQQEQVSEEKPEKTPPNMSEYKTYFLAKEDISPTSVKCSIEARPGITLYDKKDKRGINFTSSNIEVIANTATFSDDRKLCGGSLLITIKYKDVAGQERAPDVTIRKKNTSYTNISDLTKDYDKLNRKVMIAHGKDKRMKLANWELLED